MPGVHTSELSIRRPTHRATPRKRDHVDSQLPASLRNTRLLKIRRCADFCCAAFFRPGNTPPAPAMKFASRLASALQLLAALSAPHLSSAYQTLSDDTLKSLPQAPQDFDIHTGALLAPILIPRVPGTPGNEKVRQHFLDFFASSLPNWHVELHNSTSTTPTSNGKEIPFVNVIATRDPPWAKPGDVGRLALVAHYDSKLTPHGFIGATDSAAPCAMLMHAARSIDEALTKKWEKMEADGLGDGGIEEDRGVQIILLDGEEAFLSWTDADSLYGAR